MPEVIITENTVPGTDVVITVARRTRLIDGKVWFTTTREPGTSDFVNYLRCGRSTETEAHEQADFLWNDTVERRDANTTDSASTYRPRCHWCDARCALISHPDGHSKSDDCRCARHAVPSHRRNKICLGCDATLALSDPDICEKCDEHGIIVVNGKAYAPVRS